MRKNRFWKKEQTEKILYKCRSTMRTDQEWELRNVNGHVSDYGLLIQNIKALKQANRDNQKILILDLNLWKVCLDAFEEIIKVYKFQIDWDSYESNNTRTKLCKEN